jgi:hypothetical protein
MLSGVLRGSRTIEVNIAIMRAFVRFRELIGSNKGLARRLAELEKEYGATFRCSCDAHGRGSVTRMAGTIFIFGARWARLNIAMVNVPVLVPVSPKISQPAARHSCLGLEASCLPLTWSRRSCSIYAVSTV